MKSPFELKPIFVAGLVGAALMMVYTYFGPEAVDETDFAAGFGIGAGVQIAVRLFGVS